MDLQELEEKLGSSFSDKNLLKEALTHRSYLNERPEWGIPHNERFEFFGDAVLELIVTEELFHRFPDYEEGTMTSFRAALVNYVMLASIARGMELEKFIFLSKGESKDKGRAREVILANTFEAVVGALYLDAGYETTKKFINAKVMPRMDEVIKNKSYRDAKSLLQEYAQSERKVTPTYKVVSETGPDHDKVFNIAVFFGDEKIAEGKGPSKQEGEVEAARRALELIGTNGRE